MRSNLQPGKVKFRHFFQPHRLPDTGGLNIPAAKIFLSPPLFSSGLTKLIGIFSHDRDPVFSLDKKLCYIEGKPGIAPFVGAGQLSVYPYFCIEITAFKVKEIPLFFFLFQRQRSLIPHSGMAFLTANAAFFCLVGKGHQDFFSLRKLLWPLVFYPFPAVIKGKIPFSV